MRSAPATAATRVLDYALDGPRLVEASAGTGKTFTISQLYVRLVVEGALGVDRILVVTYTVAATEELRARVRASLAGARAQLVAGAFHDEFLRDLARRTGAAQALSRIEAALSGFDEAAIFTIHGFCQRVLADAAFEAGMPFQSELLADESALLSEIAADFWRRRTESVPRLLARTLVDTKGLGPEGVLADVRSYIGRPYLRQIEPPPGLDVGAAEAALGAAFSHAAAAWEGGRDAVQELLTAPEILNRNSYPLADVLRWMREIDEYFRAAGANDPPPEKLPRLSRTAIERAARKAFRGALSGHSLFSAAEPVIEAVDQLLAAKELALGAISSWLAHLRVDLLAFARTELARRKERRRVKSYDDLLLDLHGALERDHSGRLAEAIRTRYGAALIDEFQDTDPVQYGIFEKIYGGSRLPVFFVGDPKQAIYSFRGADVFAYLRAAAAAPSPYRLESNWRSAPGLVSAVNAAFAGARPFLLREIPFTAVVAAPEAKLPDLVIEGEPDEPLQIRLLERDGASSKALDKEIAREIAVRSTAAEIAHLLRLARDGRARLGERAVAGGDIAVLVRTNAEARSVREELLHAGVPSVQHAMESVFASRECQDLERALLSISAPSNEGWLKAALLTDALGFDAAAIHRLQQPGAEAAWQERAERIRSYHDLWRDEGFSRMFRQLLVSEGVLPRLLRFADGERRVTNLLHLGELLAEAEAQEDLGIESGLRWLADRRREASGERVEAAEDRQLRLESDENLVQIVTVHKAKGLQYGIVFCPFLWDGLVQTPRPGPFSFHDPETEAPTLDLSSEDAPELREHAMREEIAEKLRLAYVALTRARHRCVVLCGAIKNAGTSALAWLLHRHRSGGDPGDPLAFGKTFETLSDSEIADDLASLARRSGGSIRVDTASTRRLSPYAAELRGSAALSARTLTRAVPPAHRVASFSALIETRGEHATGASEQPDYDSRRAPPAPAGVVTERTIFSFPRGVRAGRFLHGVLEDLDFTAMAAPEAAARARVIEPIVDRHLTLHRLEPTWRDVAVTTVDRTSTLPLDRAGAIRLAGLRPVHVVRELEFYYPVARLDAPRLVHLLRRHSLAGGRFDADLAALSFDRLDGFMKGFIDLVFEADGRFYLLDYKSNHLGDRSEDYAPERLDAAMGRGGYYLQYLIYAVTLHRLLGLRLPGYDPARHLGGVFYVFLRGLDPKREAGWSVFHDRPSADLVCALDRLIGGSRGDGEAPVT